MLIMRLALPVLLAALLPAAAHAQAPVDTSADSARRYRAPSGAALTPPSAESPGAVVAAFVRARLDAPTADSLALRKEDLVARTGVTHLEFGQRVAGLDVHGTYVRASVNARGELVNLIENLAPLPPALVPASVDARGALESVLRRYYPGREFEGPEIGTEGASTTFGAGGLFSSGPTVTRVAVPMTNGAMHTGFLVETWDTENVLRHTVVGPGGQILREELRTNSDSYKVFPDHPGNSIQTVVSGPGAGNAQSPVGWVAGTTTTGNNVDAYLDRDKNNAPDPNGRPGSATQDFLYTADLNQTPTTATNQMAAVTNLFYLNNVIHDKLYRHGFTEAAGNFQADNFGKGGQGNDPVLAEAQDGSGTNNANFSTPADGSKPRMQMFLWTYTTPNRDGDLDSDIVWHEYGHGLTWRMVGDMSGPLAGAIGEGMSDTLSIYVNRNDVVGEYSYNNTTTGIRRYPYTNYPLTYGDVTGSSVHADGEIYAAAMWKLLELWEGSGRTQDQLFNYVIDGMNFTPSRPAYEDMRDGILAAMPGQEEQCLVWKAFAQFGIGQGADGRESCFIFTCRVSITESFVEPSACSGGGANTAPAVSITGPASNSTFAAGAAVTFVGTATDTQDGNLSGSLVWTSSLDGPLGSGASFTTSLLRVGTHTVMASVTDSGGLSGSASVVVTIEPVGAITLTASGYTVKTQLRVDLTWSGATGANVDIYRNGSLLTTTANDGSHTDKSGLKKGRSYTYRVCNAGTTTCSADQTVFF